MRLDGSPKTALPVAEHRRELRRSRLIARFVSAFVRISVVIASGSLTEVERG